MTSVEPDTPTWNAPCAAEPSVIRTDVAVIGGGAAGLTAAQVAATAGRTVVLIERDRVGGECLFTGCIPSKTLLAIAGRVHHARRARELGLDVNGTPDWSTVRAHVRAVIRSFHDQDGPDALARRGVQVINGTARFVAHRTLDVRCGTSTRRVHARQVILATGASVRLPADIDGLRDVPHLTHETLLDLPEPPAHLLVVGGGAIGCEFAQAFRRLGSTVTLVERGPRVLPQADPQVSARLLRVLRDEGTRVHLRTTVTCVRTTPDGDGVRARLSDGSWVEASHLLLATGKRPNIHGLGLEVIGAPFDDEGLRVDTRMRSVGVTYLWGAGDVVGGPMYTHGATERGTLAALGALGVVGRALGRWRAPRARVEDIPAVTFTEPEVACWGLTEMEAARRYGRRAQVVEFDFRHLDRAVAQGEPGLVKLVVRSGWFGTPFGVRVVGVHVVGGPAGELAQQLSLPARLGVHPWRLALLPAPYPTFAEATRLAMLGLVADDARFGERRAARATDD